MTRRTDNVFAFVEEEMERWTRTRTRIVCVLIILRIEYPTNLSTGNDKHWQPKRLLNPTD